MMRCLDQAIDTFLDSIAPNPRPISRLVAASVIATALTPIPLAPGPMAGDWLGIRYRTPIVLAGQPGSIPTPAGSAVVYLRGSLWQALDGRGSQHRARFRPVRGRFATRRSSRPGHHVRPGATSGRDGQRRTQ